MGMRGSVLDAVVFGGREPGPSVRRRGVRQGRGWGAAGPRGGGGRRFGGILGGSFGTLAPALLGFHTLLWGWNWICGAVPTARSDRRQGNCCPEVVPLHRRGAIKGGGVPPGRGPSRSARGRTPGRPPGVASGSRAAAGCRLRRTGRQTTDRQDYVASRPPTTVVNVATDTTPTAVLATAPPPPSR